MADAIIGPVITLVNAGVVCVSVKMGVSRMLDGVEAEVIEQVHAQRVKASPGTAGTRRSVHARPLRCASNWNMG